ncbi:membrane protein [Streptococcus suis]|nr:membrane protein [Streptococcus suis]
MIKIFGKIRYHWQPDLSWAIIYWSLTFTPIFIGEVASFKIIYSTCLTLCCISSARLTSLFRDKR